MCIVAILLTLLSQQQYQLRLRYMHDHFAIIVCSRTQFFVRKPFWRNCKKKLTNQLAAVFMHTHTHTHWLGYGSTDNYFFGSVYVFRRRRFAYDLVLIRDVKRSTRRRDALVSVRLMHALAFSLEVSTDRSCRHGRPRDAALPLADTRRVALRGTATRSVAAPR